MMQITNTMSEMLLLLHPAFFVHNDLAGLQTLCDVVHVDRVLGHNQAFFDAVTSMRILCGTASAAAGNAHL